jgi:hypothetical protein
MRHRLVVLVATLAVGGLAVAGLTACSRDKGDRPDPQAQPPVPTVSTGARPSMAPLPSASAGVTPGGAASGRPSPTTPTDPAGAVKGRPQSLPTGTEIKATGIGPYTIGQEQAALTTAKLVGPIKSGSTGCDTGSGVAKWGSPALFFTKGKLQHVKISSAAVKTTAGVKVGTTEAGVRAAYPKGSALGGGTAWFAPTGDFALVFRLAGGKVSAVEAGPTSIMETGAAGC